MLYFWINRFDYFKDINITLLILSQSMMKLSTSTPSVNIMHGLYDPYILGGGFTFKEGLYWHE